MQQLKDFLVHSQFLIITHNQQTIASADIVYGVTMPEKGISKVVSMRLKEIGIRELAIEPSPEAAIEPPSDAPPPKRSRKKAAASAESDKSDLSNSSEQPASLPAP